MQLRSCRINCLDLKCVFFVFVCVCMCAHMYVCVREEVMGWCLCHPQLLSILLLRRGLSLAWDPVICID